MIDVSTKCVDEVFHAGAMGEGLMLISAFMQENFDIDIMLTYKNRLVVERQDIPLHKCCQILKLVNSSSYPGYATLKLPDTNCDAEYLYGEDFKHELKDSFITECLFVLLECNMGSINTTHGPAKVMDIDWNFFRDLSSETMQALPKTVDIVRSIRCFEWPSAADEWIDRRRFNWPSIELITEIKKIGCDVVPTGCHGSSTHIKEWRISLVRAERHLIHSLNDAQLKTFILLKMVFRSRVFGEEFHNTISSYVAKCSFFWVSEEYDGSKWKETHCIKYLWLCLQKIRNFVEEGNCPHYFMRKCNVLHGKLNDEKKTQLLIKIDIFTDISRFKRNMFSLPTFINVTSFNLGGIENGFARKLRKCFEEFLAVYIFNVMHTVYNDQLMDAIVDLLELLEDFQKKLDSCPSVLFYHGITDFVRWNLERLKNVAIQSGNLSTNVQHAKLKTFLLKGFLHEQVCSGLSQISQTAHLLFTNKLYEEVLAFLEQINFRIKQMPFLGIQEIQFPRICTSYKDEMQKFWNSCFWPPVCNITFFKLEESILSDDIRLELFAAEVALKQQRHKIFYLYCINVHPLVYIYYMKYKCCRNLKGNSAVGETYTAIKDLVKQVLAYTSYEYYSLNLLGCCLTEEGCFRGAIKIFSKAYQKRLHRTSVVYHTALLLRKAFTGFETAGTDPKISKSSAKCRKLKKKVADN